MGMSKVELHTYLPEGLIFRNSGVWRQTKLSAWKSFQTVSTSRSSSCDTSRPLTMTWQIRDSR